ncbi:hypothetical protein FOZ62_014707 [Perkinsus olseni]|uniref:C6H2-type domain-containing protein n=1 Tax=Perkinsus olseni TaxID=32597 RepID=A0A7J6TCH4_PEROL|nr:hypothetical protein FOZ62_014707 [Perkinsus olseni]
MARQSPSGADSGSSGDEGDSTSPNQVSCQGCGRWTETKLCCPKCSASFARTSFFCNQKCFEDNWAEHSKLHTVLAKAARIERERAKATGKTEATPAAAGWIPPFAGKRSESTAAATAAMREVITHRTAFEERRRQRRGLTRSSGVVH